MRTITSIKNVGIINTASDYKKRNITCKRVIELLQKNKKEVFLDSQSCAEFENEANLDLVSLQQMAKKCDLVIIIGGDGSLLHAAKNFVEHQVPLIGVNLGHLGYLADIPAEDILKLLQQILNQKFIIDQRLMLKVIIRRNDKIVYEQLALNEFTLSRKENGSMIRFATSIDNRFLQSQRSDGIIVCTPTGSTAYSLSVGGPILDPQLDCINLCSINAHSLTYRPIVISANSAIQISCNQKQKEYAVVLCDGSSQFYLDGNDQILIKRHSTKLNLVHPENYDSFKILRKKLSWSSEL